MADKKVSDLPSLNGADVDAADKARVAEAEVALAARVKAFQDKVAALNV